MSKKKKGKVKKIIYLTLIGLAVINLLLMISGMVLPWLISTDKLPLVGISFLVTCIVAFVVTMGAILLNKILK